MTAQRDRFAQEFANNGSIFVVVAYMHYIRCIRYVKILCWSSWNAQSHTRREQYGQMLDRPDELCGHNGQELFSSSVNWVYICMPSCECASRESDATSNSYWPTNVILKKWFFLKIYCTSFYCCNIPIYIYTNTLWPWCYKQIDKLHKLIEDVHIVVHSATYFCNITCEICN